MLKKVKRKQSDGDALTLDKERTKWEKK